MILTLNAAAKAAHKSKAALLDQIRSGKLSAYQDPETKQWQIDTSELFRVNKAPSNKTAENQFYEVGLEPVEPKSITSRNHQEPTSTPVIERYIEVADRERKTLLETIADLRDRLDKSQAENSKLTTMLLTHQPPDKIKKGSKLWAIVSFSLVLAGYSIYQLYVKTNFFNF